MALVALTGAGCEPAPIPAAPAPSPAAETPSQPSVPAPSAEAPAVTPSPLPVIDATWKTYTNSSLGFSFQYPTKGTYAPTWGVTFLKTNDPKLVKGCYQGEGNPRQNQGELLVGDSTFCVTRYEDAAAGQRYFTDHYVSGRSGSVILISFSKHLTVGDNFEDVRCHGQLVLATGTSCTPVDPGVYNAALDQIVGTYTHE